MIGCETENGVEYITKLEHFKDLINENTYQALEEFLNNNKEQYQDIIDDLNSDLDSLQEDYDLLDNNYDDLQKRCNDSDEAYEDLEKKTNKLQAFYDHMKKLYGQGLEVANWHLNDDLESFDSFFDSAEESE